MAKAQMSSEQTARTKLGLRREEGENMTQTETVLISGLEAIGWGAIHAGCQAYFGYPITPQSEIPEFMSREMPKLGRLFLQTECELAASGMVYGAAMTGARAMTSTSGPGFSLMQEFISFGTSFECPAVMVNVVRGGPGTGGITAAQTDYHQATKGGGHGGYHCIVLAPASVQECFDLTQLAFHLADKYRIVTIVLTEAAVGQSLEPVELRTLDFGPIPEKDWAVRGRFQRGGKKQPMPLAKTYISYVGFHQEQIEKYQRIKDSETRYRAYQVEDAQLLLVAYGYVARMAQEAVSMARAQGLRVGLLRPITLWPFPGEAIKEAALRIGKVLVVEDSSGLMVEDVDLAVLGQVPVHLLGCWGRHIPTAGGLIYAERILEEVKSLS
jgi:2-oxoglutarate ferredoxin oxidoreductase subunit alpha